MKFDTSYAISSSLEPHSLHWFFPPRNFVYDYSSICLVISTKCNVKQGCMTVEEMIPKLQVTQSFIFYFLPQGKLQKLLSPVSVNKVCALTVWIV